MDLKDDMPTAQEMIDAGIDPDLMGEVTAQMVKGNLTRNQVIAIFKGWLWVKRDQAFVNEVAEKLFEEENVDA